VESHIRIHELKLQDKKETEIDEWLDKCKSTFSFSILPGIIHNQDEFLLSYMSGLWLLQFLNNDSKIKSSTDVFSKLEEFTNKYPQANDLWKFLNGIFNSLNDEMVLDSILLIEIPELRESLMNDTFGILLQNLLTSNDRKRLAANYTKKTSARILIKILGKNEYASIIDPFCGSGRLISAYLESLDLGSQYPRIRIHDLMPSAVLVAYCRLILILSEHNQDLSLLHVTIGDAFTTFLWQDSSKELGNHDLVLMNPPFTRTHRISRIQKESLLKIEQYYSKYLSGQVGLHIYAIFLADLLMRENGLLGAILPAATILSQYSRGVHDFFLNKYQLKTIASSEDEKAYSEDSNLREIMLIARKKSTKLEESIEFLRLASQSKSKRQMLSSNIISKKILAKEWNWTIFLRDPELQKICNILLHSGFIKSGNFLSLDIVRGVEMYGPDFFFIPNREWKIASKNIDEIILKYDRSTIEIPKKFLVQSLRKPGYYNQFITPEVSDYALSIPNSDKSQMWLKRYLEVSEQYASPAKRKFGQEWIHHIHNQIETKKPWGNLFFIDKFGITSTSVMAHFLETKLICSKNFYVLRNCPPSQAKLHAAWLNSTLYIILFMLYRREIGGSYGRLQIIDYKREPLFLDFSNFASSTKDQIIKQFDLMRRLKLPPMPDQLRCPQRRALDLAIIQGFQLPRITEEYLQVSIYPLLERIFVNLKQRDFT